MAAAGARVTLADFRAMQSLLLQTRQQLEDTREREKAALEELRMRPVLPDPASFPPPPPRRGAQGESSDGAAAASDASKASYPTELNPFGPGAAAGPSSTSAAVQTEPSALELELHDELRRTREALRRAKEELHDARDASSELTRRLNQARGEEGALEGQLVWQSISSETAEAERAAQSAALALLRAEHEEKDVQLAGLQRAAAAAAAALEAEEGARRAALAAAEEEAAQLRERLAAAEAAADASRTTPSTPSKLEPSGGGADLGQMDTSSVVGDTPTRENTAATLVPAATPATTVGAAPPAVAQCQAVAEARRDAARRAIEQRRRCTLRLVLHSWCGASRNSRILRNMTQAMRNMSLAAAPPHAAPAADAAVMVAPPPEAGAPAAPPRPQPPPPMSALQVLQVLHKDAAGERESAAAAEPPAAGLGELYEKLAAARAAQNRAEEAAARAASEARARAAAEVALLGSELTASECALQRSRDALREERTRGGEAMQDVAAALAAAHSMTLCAIEASGARCDSLAAE